MLTPKKLLPYDSFTINTSRSTEELTQLLERQVEPRKHYRFGNRDHKVFQGNFSHEGFTISRIVHYRNSFLPIIRARFQPNICGTDILVTMAPHPLVIGFMAFWLWTVGSIAMTFLVGALFSSDVPLAMCLVPSAMFIFGWALIWGGFWAEASSTKQTLITLLK